MRTPFLATPKYSGIYLDDADKIILNQATWATCVRNIRKWGHDYIMLYNVSKFCTPAVYPKIKAFIAYAKSQGIKKVGGVWGSKTTADKMRDYQDHGADSNTPFGMFMEECEVWNNGGWAAEAVVRKQVFNSARGLTTPAIKYPANAGMYFGWFKDIDAGMTTAEAADSLVTSTNRMFIHQYRDTPSWSNLLERARELDNACIRTGYQGDYEMYILISGESKSFKEKDGKLCTNEFSGQYLKTKTAKDWYNEVIVKLQAYMASNPQEFKHILFAGVWTFDYWWMMQARP